MKNILFESSAVRETLELLKKVGYRWTSIRYINKRRYCIVFGEGSHFNIAILLKTEPFFNFGYEYREFGEKGVGDSINVEALRIFARYNVKLIYTKFRDGKLYVVSLEDVLKNSYSRIQKEGTKTRVFSIHLYKRIREV